jgi:hypothetical protein
MKVHIMPGMNKFDTANRIQILSMLREGSSTRSSSRAADVSPNTVPKLRIEAGKACKAFHDAEARNVQSKRVQCDEIGVSKKKWDVYKPRQTNLKVKISN